LLFQLSLLKYDSEYDLYRPHKDIRQFAHEHLVDDTLAYLGLAHYLGEVTDQCVNLGNTSSDGFVVSLINFDYYKLRFKRCLLWLQQQPQSVETDKLILN